jgi:F-type H+-transporting ATPase subunit delta
MAAIASRYARAFAEVVLDLQLDPDQAVQQLNGLAALFASSPELRTVLSNPSVAHQQKLGLLDAIISRLGASRALRNFAAVLIDHRRIGRVGEIAEKFRGELNQRLGIAEAQVSSARELTREEKQLLEKEIARITGKRVRAAYERDSNLLGGAVVRIGSTIYDGSVRGQLRRIKEQIASS